MPPRDSPPGALAADDFRAAGLDVPRATVITYTNIARLALVAKGRFLTIANTASFTGLHAAIKALPIELASAHRSVGIVTLKNRTLTPVAQLFIDCARGGGKANGNAPTPTASKIVNLRDTKNVGLWPPGRHDRLWPVAGASAAGRGVRSLGKFRHGA